MSLLQASNGQQGLRMTQWPGGVYGKGILSLDGLGGILRRFLPDPEDSLSPPSVEVSRIE